MLIFHKGHTDTVQVYSVTVMTHVKALQAGHSSQGTSAPITPGFLIKSLSDHYSSPGRLAEYKCQFQQAFRHPGDDPSIFAIELETLARRAFIDIDPLIQLQMVRDRFIDGQAECALRRHLDSLGSDTPMADIVDCCRVWESHLEVEIEQQTRTDRRVRSVR